MQAYDEKEGPIDSKPSPAKPEVKKESKDEKAAKEPKNEKAASKASTVTNTSVSHLHRASPEPKASAKHEVVAHRKNASTTHKLGVNASQTKKHETNLVVAKTIGNHDPSHPKSVAAKTNSTAQKGSKASKVVHKDSTASKPNSKASKPSHKETKASIPKKHSVGNVTNTSKGKTNATDVKGKVTALAKTNATATKMTAEEKKAEDKKYGGFLSGFVL
eukprot:gnl/MRDRNA2_/MRDRNA2_103668_c0_seq1.p1 gnl/MRDRNA2_/MRDRNA2_103668_c0~~gnl/MRDRNA2_/MRDRNA2_103668_c0_seq1.p1  ORF type:complete len:225 (-),score=69.54 gnl/MRDRNA2_/MRDRNA2_103668_c0_seq1:13-666(-)